MTHSRSPDFTLIEWYAQRAAMAYNGEAAIRAAFPNTTLVATSRDQVQFFLEVDHTKKQQIIVVRGTANLSNAREDADYIQGLNSRLGIWVHRGFDADAQVVYEMVRRHLVPEYEIILTGHSLGAAISTLLMMYFSLDGLPLGPSINFGQPKVTNKKGVQLFANLPLARVVDENDLVPLVPPIDLIDEIHGGYEHVGTELVLLAGEYYCLLDEARAEHISLTDFWANLGNMSVHEHYMANYLANIQTKLLKSLAVPYVDRKKYYRLAASGE